MTMPESPESAASPVAADAAPADVAPVEEAVSVAPRKRRRPVGWIIAVALLAAALIAAAVVLVQILGELDRAQDLIEEQEELIDEKESFGAAMGEFLATTAALEGVPFSDIVPRAQVQSLVRRAWEHRWEADVVRDRTDDVRALTEELAGVIAAAAPEAAGNASGTTFEAVIDQLGKGYVTSLIDDADALCEQDVLGCVTFADPYTVHFDAAELTLPYLNDWLQTGIAYHEFAHVLQFTNPEPTATAAEAFGGDWETMADCFALTYLAGWTLDHRIWVSSYEYWDVSVGYGYTCDETQRQVVRDWYEALGVDAQPYSA